MSKKPENLSSAFRLSKHAVLRMAQRNVSRRDLQYVIEHGKRTTTSGITFYLLRKRDIPDHDRNKSEITRLRGTVVLTGLTPKGGLEIITTYRNMGPFKMLCGRPKYDARKRYRTDHRPQLGE